MMDPCYLFFLTEWSLPEGLPGPPVKPVRYPIVGLELFQDLAQRNQQTTACLPHQNNRQSKPRR